MSTFMHLFLPVGIVVVYIGESSMWNCVQCASTPYERISDCDMMSLCVRFPCNVTVCENFYVMSLFV